MRRFAPQHDDLVHDLAYDFYGRRLATCSSDQRIKVWDRQGGDSNGGNEPANTAEGGDQISGSGNRANWQHNANNRQGAPYRDQGSRDKFDNRKAGADGRQCWRRHGFGHGYRAGKRGYRADRQ